MTTRILFGQPNFSADHEWSEILDHFPPGIAEQVELEIVPTPAMMDRLLGEGPAVDIVVPIAAALQREAFEKRTMGLVHQFGAGYDSIDVASASEFGIPVANLPGVNAPEVAEHAVLLTLALLRNLPEAEFGFTPGNWSAPGGRSLGGSTVVVVGLGAVGIQTLSRLASFRAELHGVYRSAPPAGPLNDGTELPEGVVLHPSTGLHEALALADVVIVAAAARAGQPPVIDAAAVAAIKPGAVLVNVARGAVIDGDAVIAALDSGRLHRAGIDVFPVEPYPADGALHAHPRILATAHVASLTKGYFVRASEHFGEAVRAYIRGERPRFQLN